MATIEKSLPNANVSGGVFLDPNNTMLGIGQWTDQKRALIFEWPVLIFSVGYLWHRGFVSGRESNATFGFGDFLFVIIAAYMLKRIGVMRRWEGM